MEPEEKLGLALRLAKRLYPVTLAISFLISFGAPVTYFVIESSALRRTATIQAQELSKKLEYFVLDSPVLWKYQAHKYIQVLANDLVLQSEVTTIRVLDETGKSITGYEYATKKGQLWWNRYAPVGSARIVFNNREIGTVKLAVSQSNLLGRTLLLLLASIVTGTGLAVLVYRFPIKVVRGMEGQIQELIEAVQTSEQQFRDLVQGLDAIVWEGDPKTFRFTFVSRRAEEILGYPVKRWLTEPDFWFNIMHPEDREQASAFDKKMLKEGSGHNSEYRVVAADGHVVWLHDTVYVVRDDEGQACQFRGVKVDVTERKQIEEALKESEQQYRDLFDNASDLIQVVAPDGHFLYVNYAWRETLGYNEEEIRQLLVIDIIHPDCQVYCLEIFQRVISGENVDKIEAMFVTKVGKTITVEGSSNCKIVDGKPVSTRGMFRNITERKRTESQLWHNAFHDALTDLPNRALFMKQLDRAIEQAKRHQDYLFAVLFLDLDRFKVINDSLGHLIGDQLLVVIARRLEACLRPGDTVARLGGDEFTILLDNIKDLGQATDVAERIQVSLARSFNLNGHEVFTNASIGITLNTIGYGQPEDILRDADAAMYRAKSLGKGRYEVFNTTMHAWAVALLQLETDLRRAIERQEFHLYYQPVVYLKTGRLVGFEALIRWQHPRRGLLSPEKFIPIAEETGLIVPIGEWILREACRQMQAWQIANTKELNLSDGAALPLSISVNVSSKQFSQANLIAQVSQTLRETGLDVHSLKLEITESCLMASAESATSILSELRTLGVQLAIDDFGTGYSSLSYLHRFPVNTLKIDSSFITNISSGGNSGIVRAIITLAHELGLDAIAEGVETKEQLAELRALKCEYGQGYFFSKPLQREMAEELIAEASHAWDFLASSI